MFQPGYFRVHAVTLWNASRLPPRVYLEPRGKGSRDCANGGGNVRMASREQQPRGRRNRMSAWYGADLVAEKAANPYGRNSRIDYSGPASDVRQCRPCGEQLRSLHIYRNT